MHTERAIRYAGRYLLEGPFSLSNQAISGELNQFIRRYVHSVEQLEVLCLLAENASKTWMDGDVFNHIQSSRDSVLQHLRRFCEAGLAAGAGESGFRFAPDSEEKSRLATELARTYRERRVAVVEAIYKAPLTPIQQFADAFKIRKEGK